VVLDSGANPDGGRSARLHRARARRASARPALPFATIEQASGRAIGSTLFGNIDRSNRRVEIGWAWLAQPWHRTRANTEAKYLMLRHAFESWGAIRVELKPDALNKRSRNAILGIGAKQEGVLCNHIVTSTGRLRDTVYFSIIAPEWPEVKAKLEQRLCFAHGESTANHPLPAPSASLRGGLKSDEPA
jgi:RimJ/RimL family protein N-acetyltransferase